MITNGINNENHHKPNLLSEMLDFVFLLEQWETSHLIINAPVRTDPSLLRNRNYPRPIVCIKVPRFEKKIKIWENMLWGKRITERNSQADTPAGSGYHPGVQLSVNENGS